MKEETGSYLVMAREKAIAVFEGYLKEAGIRGEIEDVNENIEDSYRISFDGSHYLLVPIDKPNFTKYLAYEPLGYIEGYFIFPLEPRKRAFFFTVFSETYGYQEFGPFESYHKAQIEIHKLKGRVNQRNDGVYRYFSEVFERPQPPKEAQTQDPVINSL